MRHAELLGGHVTDTCRPAGEDLGDRHDEHPLVGRHLHLEHRHFAVLAGAHDEVRECGHAAAPPATCTTTTAPGTVIPAGTSTTTGSTTKAS